MLVSRRRARAPSRRTQRAAPPSPPPPPHPPLLPGGEAPRVQDLLASRLPSSASALATVLRPSRSEFPYRNASTAGPPSCTHRRKGPPRSLRSSRRTRRARSTSRRSSTRAPYRHRHLNHRGQQLPTIPTPSTSSAPATSPTATPGGCSGDRRHACATRSDGRSIPGGGGLRVKHESPGQGLSPFRRANPASVPHLGLETSGQFRLPPCPRRNGRFPNRVRPETGRRMP